MIQYSLYKDNLPYVTVLCSMKSIICKNCLIFIDRTGRILYNAVYSFRDSFTT